MGVYIKYVQAKKIKKIFEMLGIRINEGDIVEVKEPHGPLIDIDELSKRQVDYTMSGHANSAEDCKEFGMMIITAPTVIDAEGKDEED